MTHPQFALRGGYSSIDQISAAHAAHLYAISSKFLQKINLTEDVPKVTTFGEIIGWRAWLVDPEKLTLKALFHRGFEWQPGVNKAIGLPSEEGEVGLHAHRHMQGLFKQEGTYWQAIGTVLMWGDVVEHEAGYRAEFARVETLRLFRPGVLTEDQRVKLIEKYAGGARG